MDVTTLEQLCEVLKGETLSREGAHRLAAILSESVVTPLPITAEDVLSRIRRSWVDGYEERAEARHQDRIQSYAEELPNHPLDGAPHAVRSPQHRVYLRATLRSRARYAGGELRTWYDRSTDTFHFRYFHAGTAPSSARRGEHDSYNPPPWIATQP